MALPKLDDWKAPWEVDATGGTIPNDDQQIDPGKLKKYLHGLLTDKERLQASVTTVTGERDTLKAQIDEKDREGEDEVARLKREHSELKAQLDKAGETSIETLKLRVALRKGLTEHQAKRLVGKDEAELETDADELVESFGGTGKNDDPENGGDVVRRQPRRLHNNGDPDETGGGGGGLPEPTLENINKLIPM